MSRAEKVELTNLCLLHRDGKYLLQNRFGSDWRGYALPGGHVEPNESFVESVIREMKEETGLTVINPRLCGELCSSEEGEMEWVDENRLGEIPTVADLRELISVMLSPELNEFQYVIEDGKWRAVFK